MDSIPLIDPGVTGLHDVRPAGVFPVLAEGESIWVRGVASRPELEVGSGGRTIVRFHAKSLGTAANILHFPGILRRDFAAPTGSVVETVLAMPTLPVVVVQWSATGEATPTAVEVAFDGVTGRARLGDEGQVLVEGVGLEDGEEPGRGARLMEVRLVPQAADVRLDETEGRLRVTLRPAENGHVSLVLALGDAQGRPPPMAATRHVPSHALRAASGPTAGLLLGTGLPEVDDAVAWLRVRLAGQARRLSSDVDSASALSVGLAATAVGDRDSSAAVLSIVPADSATHGLLAARHAAVFGETGRARESAARWASESPVPSPLAALAARELADALHLVGDARTVASLRAIAAAQANPPSAPSGTAAGRSLPMAGRARPATGPLSMMGDPSSPLTTRGLDIADIATIVTGDYGAAERDPEAAWIAWREAIVDASGRVVTLWDDESSDGGSRTAGLLLTLSAGLLGLRADAGVGRLRIAPRLPRHLTRFEASGITVGSSAITVRYSATRDTLRYELVPEAAAVPPLVVFEPVVSGLPQAITIDGEVAELDPREKGARTVIPVQLPLDATRVVEITMPPDETSA